MRKIIFAIGLCCLVNIMARGQVVAVKANLLQWATASFNVEPEVRVGSNSTLGLFLSWNPFLMDKETNLKWKHFIVQPEYRYWFCKAFTGHFVGVHPGYAHYNIGAIGERGGLFGEFSQSRYQGDVVSLGVGYGFHWIVSPHFSIEAEAGVGVACTWYDRYCHQVCGKFYEHVDARWFFTPTKLSVSLIYVIK